MTHANFSDYNSEVTCRMIKLQRNKCSANMSEIDIAGDEKMRALKQPLDRIQQKCTTIFLLFRIFCKGYREFLTILTNIPESL